MAPKKVGTKQSRAKKKMAPNLLGRQNGKEAANLKTVKDILDIWDVIDTQKAGQTTQTFVAENPNRLPKKWSKAKRIFLKKY